jgi:Bacterial TniB protein
MKSSAYISAVDAPTFILTPFHTIKPSTEILDAMQEALDTHSRLNRVHIVVTGPSGVGKSAIAEKFTTSNAEFWKEKDGDQVLIKPVIYVRLPRGASPAVTASRVARAIGLARYDRKTERVLTHEILDAIDLHEIKMIIIDEAQHIRVSTSKPNDDVRHLLKDLDNEGRVNIAFFGMEECVDVITMDSQLNTRFAAHYKLEAFHLKNKTNAEEFRLLLRDIDMSTSIAYSGLDSPRMTLSLFLASGGVLRTLLQIIGFALKYAIEDRARCIRKKDLAKAYRSFRRPESFIPFNPFEASEKQICNSDKALETILVK